MTCESAREWFSALVDEALAPDEQRPLEAHLAGCGECRRELERFRDTVGLLRAMPADRAPAGFVDRVLAATRPVPWVRRLARWLFVPIPVKLPLEAAALVLVSVSVLYVIQRSPDLRQGMRADAPVGGRSAPSPPAGPPAGPASSPVAPGPMSGPAAEGRTEPVREPQAGPASPKPAAGDAAPRERSTAFRPSAPGEPPATSSPPVSPPPGSGPSPRQAEGPMRDTGKTEAGPPAPAKEQAASGAVTSEARPDPARNLSALNRPLAKARSLAPPDVTGRLAVPARETAERALDDLVRRLGGARLTRRGAQDTAREATVDLVVPGETYAELLAGLDRIGRWTSGREPATIPPEVRVEVTIIE